MKSANSILAAVIVLLAIFSISKGHAQTLGPNGHYYKVVQEPNLLWDDARIKAAESTFNNVHGYLATITSAAEDNFIDSLRSGIRTNLLVWVGGSQETNAVSSTNGWSWINGEGPIAGQDGGATYANWIFGEPNDAGGPNSEQYLAIGSVGWGWSSEADDRHVEGYVIEYPSVGTTARVWVTTTDPIAVDDPSAAPDAIDIATFTFQRQGDLSQDLPIFYSIAGSAINGDDYDEISQSIVIPAGESTARLDIVPRANLPDFVEPMETVGIRIEPSLILTPEAAYTIDALRREAGAVIYEKRPPQEGALALALPPNALTYQLGESIVILAALSFSNQVPTVDFTSVDINSGASNKIGSAFQVHRTNELAFYRFSWTNAAPGEYLVSARSTNSSAPQLTSLPIRVIVAAPSNTSLVKIRAVPVDNGSPFTDYANGYFEISRTGPTNQNLQVFYTISGNAEADVDYDALANYVVIGAGRTTAKITVTALDDDTVEGNELVILSLIDSTNSVSPTYIVDQSNRQASVTIVDADTPPPTLQWEQISPYPTADSLYSTAFGNGVFVAVGSRTTILYSTNNGASWNHGAGVGVGTANLVSVRFGNGAFVAVGNAGQSFMSTDGRTWTAHPLGGNFNTMSFGNGLFVAGSEEGIIAISPDGATWNFNTTTAAAPLRLSAFGNGRFILKERATVPNPAYTQPLETFVTSTDGVTWTRYNAVVPVPTDCGGRFPPCSFIDDFAGLTFANGKFYVSFQYHRYGHLVSNDGVTWTEAPGASLNAFYNMTSNLDAANGQAFKLSAYSPDGPVPPGLFGSADFVNWQNYPLPGVSYTTRGVAFGNSTYVVVGDAGYIVRGTNLNALQRVDSPEKTADVYSVAANGNTIIGVTADLTSTANFVISTNGGRTFVTPAYTPSWVFLQSIKYDNGQFVAVGGDTHAFGAPGSAVFSRSADGITWTDSELSTGTFLTDLTFANGLWVGVGQNGTIVTSPDAAALTARNSGTDIDLFGVANGGGVVVAVGESGAILRSTNGTNWTLNGTVEGSALRGVAFGNGIFVAVGDSGRVYTSAGGSSWTARRILGANSLVRVAFAHGLFTAVEADSGKVYVSADAISWSTSNLGVTLLGADSSDGELWVSGKGTVIYREQSAASTNPPPSDVVLSVEATVPEIWEPYPEGLAGKFTVRRTGPLDSPLTAYMFLGGTATQGVDYTTDTNSIVFNAGQSEVIRFIEALPDDLVEPTETVFMQLITRGGIYTVDTNQSRATITIRDRDSLPTVSIEATQPDAWEPYPDSIPGAFTIRRTGPTDTNMTVWVAFGGTAKLNLDYSADTNSVEFLPGQSEVVRYITPLPDDLVETNETVGMQIIGRGSIYNTDPTNAFATVIIHDRDSLPTISIEATQPDTWEQSAATLPGQFTIRRTGPTNDAITVYMFLGGTAKNGLDYNADTNSVEFAAGQTFVIRTVTPIPDDLVETNETVFMQLVGRGLVYNVNLDQQRAAVTIHDGVAPNQLKFESCVRVDNGVRLTLHADPGQVTTLQRSTDLQTWDDVTTVTVANGTVDYIDSGVSGPHVYYRLKTQ
jgi:hypothetical protein